MFYPVDSKNSWIKFMEGKKYLISLVMKKNFNEKMGSDSDFQTVLFYLVF